MRQLRREYVAQRISLGWSFGERIRTGPRHFLQEPPASEALFFWYPARLFSQWSYRMSVSTILAQIDAEIAQLQAARAALTGSTKGKRGKAAVTAAKAKKGARSFTAEQKAEASKRMKAAWAKRKAAAKTPKAKKAAAKKAAPAS